MANKVLSIKIEETEIEKLKEYYEALIKLGVITNENLKFNGFLKHLLMDSLAHDYHMMLDAFSEIGALPQCIDPAVLDGSESIKLINPYNFDDESFEYYKKSYKAVIQKSFENFQECAEILMNVTGVYTEVETGMNCGLYTIPELDEEDKGYMFWANRAAQQSKYDDNAVTDIEHDILLIKKADIPEDAKERIIEQIRLVDAERKNNRALLNGRIQKK